MGKLILFNLMTLDGFFAGPDGEIDWHNVDEEFNEFAILQLNTAEGLVFGRTTYELMANYWPTAEARANDPEVASRMNDLPKMVVSRTLERADWEHTTLIRDNVAAELARRKQDASQDWLIFGSADLAASLVPTGLIDEYRVIINPIILGQGRPLFQDVTEQVRLRLLHTRTFANGNVLLYYAPENTQSGAAADSHARSLSQSHGQPGAA